MCEAVTDTNPGKSLCRGKAPVLEFLDVQGRLKRFLFTKRYLFMKRYLFEGHKA
jgi:hypothetical protein